MSIGEINTDEENFICKTYRIFGTMQDEANKASEASTDMTKFREGLWKAANAKRQKLELQQANLHLYVAYLTTALTAVSTVCGAIAAFQGVGSNFINKTAAEQLKNASSLSEAASSRILPGVSQSWNTTNQSKIGELQETATSLWSQKQIIDDQYKEEMKTQKSRLNDASQTSMDKVASAYSVR